MKGLVLVLLVAVGNGNWLTDKIAKAGIAAMGFDATDTCGFTREDALECIAKYVDYNHDKTVSCEEFERSKMLFLPPRMREALWIAKKFGFAVGIQQLMYGCDANLDCVLTEDDFRNSEKKCLHFKADLCKVKTACDIAAKSTEELTQEQWAEAKETCDAFPLEQCLVLQKKWADDDARAEALKAYQEHLRKTQ